MLQKIQTKFQDWKIHKLTETERIEWLKTYLAEQIAKTIFGDSSLPAEKRVGDNVHEIAVEESLFQEVGEALQNINEIPEGYMPDPTQAETLNGNFSKYCKERIVRPIPLENYNYPMDLDPIPAEQLFLNIHTSDQYARVETQAWLNQSGLVEYMQSKGFSFTPNYNEARMLLFISNMLEVLALRNNEQQRQVELASSNNVQMFAGK